MPDTFTSLWERLLLRVPALGPSLARDMVKDAFNVIVERREWSWRQKSMVLFPPVFLSPGTISVVPSSPVVTGSGTNFGLELIGKQIRMGGLAGGYPAYTILSVLSTTSLILDQGWSGTAQSGILYQLFQCYYPMPADFSYLYSMANTPSGYRVNTNVTQQQLDTFDPQRITCGQIYATAFRDYTASFSGAVEAPLQVVGSGPSPMSGTSMGYSYPSDSLYVITVTTGGTVGNALYSWRQDSNAAVTGVVTDNNPLGLSNGVEVYWPDGTYVQGDVFIVKCNAVQASALVRIETWPWPINAQYAYPMLYICRPPDLDDDNQVLPPNVPGYVVLEKALESSAMWPGTDSNKNAYYGIQYSVSHRNRFAEQINRLEMTDDSMATKDFTWKNMPYYPLPWADGSYLQSHAYYNG